MPKGELRSLEELAVETGIVWTSGYGFPFWDNNFVWTRLCLTPTDAEDHFWAADGMQTPFTPFYDWKAEAKKEQKEYEEEKKKNIFAYSPLSDKPEGEFAKKSGHGYSHLGMNREKVLEFITQDYAAGKELAKSLNPHWGEFLWAYVIVYNNEEERKAIFDSEQNKKIVQSAVFGRENITEDRIIIPEALKKNKFYKNMEFVCSPSLSLCFNTGWDKVGERFKRSYDLAKLQKNNTSYAEFANDKSNIISFVSLPVYPLCKDEEEFRKVIAEMQKDNLAIASVAGFSSFGAGFSQSGSCFGFRC